MKIYCSIDFGTTFSGIAIAKDDGDVYVNQAWPGRSNSPLRKVPTVVLLEEGTPIAWGYEALEQYNSTPPRVINSGKLALASRFKLHLLPESQRPVEPLPHGSTAQSLMTYYMECLKNEAQSMIFDRFGLRCTPQDIEWCITVPAMWQASSCQTTVNCALAAGICNPLLLFEPEAASVYKPQKVPERSVTIVVDCGGGTVDLIAYTTVHDMQLGKTIVEEVCGGVAGLCGGSYVDEAFFEFLRNKLGPTYEEHMQKRPRDAVVINNNWIKIKHAFGSTSVKSSWIEIPPRLCDKLADAGILEDADDGESWEISPPDMEMIFDPTVRQILTLVRQQVEGCRNKGRPATHLLLVGGFGGSQYLERKLRSVFCSGGSNLELIVPPCPEDAVVHGALESMRGAKVIRRRIARLTFGTCVDDVYVEGRHNPEKKLRIPAYPELYALDCFEVLVRKNTLVDPDIPVSMKYSVQSAHAQHMVLRIFSSDKEDPVHVDEPGSQLLEEVTVPMPGQGLDRELEVTYSVVGNMLLVSARGNDGVLRDIRVRCF